MLNQSEKDFINSIKNKITQYNIPITIEEIFNFSTKDFIETTYTNGQSEIVNIGIEWKLCQLSAFYFIDKYAWIDFPGIGIVPFSLYYFQQEILKVAPETKKMIFLKSRQAGISTLYSLYCFWKGNFFESESIDIISTKQQKAQKFVSKMDATIKRIPNFLKTPIKNRNSQVIKWINNSEILSESASDRAGRGDTLSLLILDEVAHYQTDRLTRGIIAAAMPTLTRTGGSVTLISTPAGIGGSGSYYYEQVQQLKMKGNSNEEKLIQIDWWEIPDVPNIYPQKGFNEKIQEFVDKDYFNNLEIRKQAEKYFEPIAKNWRENDWLRKQYNDLGDLLFKQEIFHDFIVGEGQVFNEEILNKVSNDIKKYTPIEENSINGNQIKGLMIWNYPIPKHRYIIGSDVASGTSNDYSSIQVMDVETYEQVAEYKGKMPTKVFGKLIKKLAKFYNQAFVVIEANSIGEAVFNEVYYSDIDPYNNVYKQKKTKNGVSRFTGWETNVKTRQLMINNLVDWFVLDELYKQMKIKSPRLFGEMATLVFRNNRIDHAESAHDDSLIAWGLCIYLRNKATNFGDSLAFVAEDGTFIEPTKQNEQATNNEIDFMSSEYESLNDKIKEEYGVTSLDEYRWLVG